MIYTYLGALVSFSFVILSMAEMASMYVTYNLMSFKILTSTGHQHLAANTTGYPNSHLQAAKPY